MILPLNYNTTIHEERDNGSRGGKITGSEDIQRDIDDDEL